MGHFNEILAGRFNRFVQKHFSMKGREGAPTLAADIGMTMNFSSGAENRYLEGWDTFGLGFQQLAVAAQLSAFRFRNPVGSGVVCVITRWGVIDGTAGTIQPNALSSLQMTFQAASQIDENSLIAYKGWDTRGRPQGTAILSTNTAAPAAFGGQFGISAAAGAANTMLEYIAPGGEIVVLPGATIRTESNAINQNYSNTVWWRERALEASEQF